MDMVSFKLFGIGMACLLLALAGALFGMLTIESPRLQNLAVLLVGIFGGAGLLAVATGVLVEVWFSR